MLANCQRLPAAAACPPATLGRPLLPLPSSKQCWTRLSPSPAECTPPACPLPCSQYAFRAATQDTQGITWSKLGDPNNGLPGAMIIMAVEWVVFMAAAW